MSSEKFIKNKTVLITLLSACTIVIVSLGIRQTFGMFYFDFSTDLDITLSQFGFALGLQMLLWGVFGPWFGALVLCWFIVLSVLAQFGLCMDLCLGLLVLFSCYSGVLFAICPFAFDSFLVGGVGVFCC